MKREIPVCCSKCGMKDRIEINFNESDEKIEFEKPCKRCGTKLGARLAKPGVKLEDKEFAIIDRKKGNNIGDDTGFGEIDEDED